MYSFLMYNENRNASADGNESITQVWWFAFPHAETKAVRYSICDCSSTSYYTNVNFMSFTPVFAFNN